MTRTQFLPLREPYSSLGHRPVRNKPQSRRTDAVLGTSIRVHGHRSKRFLSCPGRETVRLGFPEAVACQDENQRREELTSEARRLLWQREQHLQRPDMKRREML